MKRLLRVILPAPLILLASLCYADSLTDIRTQVRRHIKDTGSTLQRYSDDFINDLINEGQKDAVNRTWCIVDGASITLTNATTYYDLASDMIAINQVYYTNSSGDNTILEEVMERSLRQSNPDFEDDSGDITEYFTRHSTSGVNALEIGFRPVPATVTSESVTYIYYAQATDLSADSDIPFTGLSHLVPYHQILGYYAAARIYLLEGSVDKASGYNALYESGVTIMKDRIGEAPNYNASFKTNLR